jgi:hypothetical protein
MSAGKGDKPRKVNRKVFNKNFDEIKWNKKEKPIAISSKKGKTRYAYK